MNTGNTENHQLWQILTRKASQFPQFAGYAVALCAQARNTTAEELWSTLGGGKEAFYRFALCRRPADLKEAFRQDVETIARYVGVDSTTLANLFREAALLESLTQNVSAVGQAKVMMAAREQDNRFDMTEGDNEGPYHGSRNNSNRN